MAHIEKRTTKSGVRFRAMVYVGTDPTGRRRLKTKTFSTYEEANAWAADRELKRSKGRLIEPSKETLAQYGRHWIEDELKDRVRATTFDGYSGSFKRYIEQPYPDAPELGQIRMNELRPEHVSRLYRWMRQDRGVSRGTVKKLHAVLRQILVFAYKSKATEEDIISLLKAPRERTNKRKVQAMSEEELGRFLEAARTVREGEDGERLPDRYYALWYLLQATGLRPGEALGSNGSIWISKPVRSALGDRCPGSRTGPGS